MTSVASRLDRFGIGLSLACAIHCAAMPLLPLMAALSWVHDQRSEWVFIVVAALVGAAAHRFGYVRHHRCAGPSVAFLTGVGLVVASRLSLDGSRIEPYVVLVGSALLLGAHVANLRLCRRCCAVAT